MYRVFISSVQCEFVKERLAIASAIRNDRVLKLFFEPFLFEETVACNKSAQDVYLDEVRGCDVYLGIFGDSYGNEDAEGVSPTEREYDAATESGRYRIAFVKKAIAKREAKELKLVAKIESDVVRKSFSSQSMLVNAVCDSLVAFLTERDQITTKAFDESYSRNVTMNDLDESKFEDYIRLVNEAGKVSFRKGITPREVLIKLNALNEENGKIVNGALPLFAKRPESVKPSWELRCLQFWGTEVTKPLPALHTYHGTVFELVDQALEFVMSHVDFWIGAPTSRTSGAAPTKSELPTDAVREAIVNAVCHRDYTDNGCVQVMVFRDRVEIINPGTLPKGWTVEKLLKVHDSKPRNEVIAKAMSWTSYVEKSGSGTGDIVQKCRAWGLPEPSYLPDAVDFKTIIWRMRLEGAFGKKSTHVKMTPVMTPVMTSVGGVGSSRLEQIVLLLKEGPMGSVELADRIGVGDPKNFRRRYANVLLDDGIAEYVIPEKPNSKQQKYRLTERGLRLLEVLEAGGGSPKNKEKGKEKSREKGKEKSKEKILRELARNPHWTASDLVRATGLSRSGVEKNIRLLKKEGALLRHGGDKGGVWVIVGGMKNGS